MNHIIHKQQVVLDIPQMEQSFNFQDRVSLLFRNEVSKQLGTLFEAIASPHQIIRVDTLRLNLGTINAQNFEAEFKERFFSEIELELSKINSDQKKGNRTEIVTDTQSLRDALIYFLQFGSLPWYAVTNERESWEADMLQLFSANEWRHIIKWIQKNYLKNPETSKRLVFQFSNNFISRLISNALDNPVESLTEIFDDFKYLLAEFLQQKPSEARDRAWRVLLGHFVLREEKHSISFLIITEFALKLSVAQFEVFASTIHIANEKIQTKSIKVLLSKLARFIDKEIRTQKDTGSSDSNILTRQALRKFMTEESNSESDSTTNFDIDNDMATSLPGAVNETSKGENTKAKPITPEDNLYVCNAGIVILHPFLEPYFTELQLMNNKHFLNDDLHARAVLLLHYLATGNETVAEFDLMLQKILCGFALEETLPPQIELSDIEKDASAKLLQSVTEYWPPLKNTSAQGLQASFLQREGKLIVADTGWRLIVEQKTIDILLGKLPWGFSTIRLPWMKEMISVEWC